MGRFAIETNVPVEKSKAEIETLVKRYGATEFTSGWKQESSMIGFRLKELFVRFELPLPNRADKRFSRTDGKSGRKLTPSAGDRKYEQEVRQRGRALTLVVKAKLEAVDVGISTIEQEFLAFIVLPSDLTIGDYMMEHALPQIRLGRNPLALSGRKPDPPIEGEFIPAK